MTQISDVYHFALLPDTGEEAFLALPGSGFSRPRSRAPAR
jgi:hypothetical protein